ncbi:TonB-dependent receptor plug domain-containing protein [Pelagicoccus mobilis]|uniref:TonB-dependent receptor plug domain-containing protein n=1 Tax=Pelagicoccus mobilis TaxID=415221 RepID=A0A934RX28_9BACT|nr:TonB-dependent receptor plug domain-containing protein [Pelagicoccus mobilis]MBK1875454.1 TonB-dependent receptor plug domain-containing protein [Pelagicoccus mobilis]
MLASLLVLTAPAWAQDDKEEEVFELSPFSVSADENSGYRANNTLAGTRLNSQLKDIASAVQVVTEEFIDDVGASSLDELLTYTTGTEAAGPSGNASFAEVNSGTARMERSRREPQLNTRVRGLARADLTRDYFQSDLAFHGYNTSTVTINRGPNASLFGLGSPGGIVNATVDQALTNRDMGELNLKWTEFGTKEVSLNYNKVLIEDKLAVRVAALNQELGYEQKNSFYNDDRYFVAATWRPFENTIIRANYEEGDASGSRAKLRPPTDRISGWFANGSPGYDATTNKWYSQASGYTEEITGTLASELTKSSTQFGSQAINGNPMVVFDDPHGTGFSVMQGGFRSDAAGRVRGAEPTPSHITAGSHAYLRQWHSAKSLLLRNPDYIVGANPNIPAGHLSFYYDPQLSDRGLFDFVENSLTGASSLHEQNFNVKNLRLEQTWLDNQVGIELAYNEQYWRASLSEAHTASSANTLNVDINLKLMDGSDNPNFGRPFIGGRGYTQGRIREREAYQATGFAKYNFADKMGDGFFKHFGDHSLTAVYQDQTFDEAQPNRQFSKASNDWNPSVARGGPGLDQAHDFATNGRSDNRTRITMIQYVGDANPSANSIYDLTIDPVSVIHIPDTSLVGDDGTPMASRWNPFTGAFEQKAIDIYTYRNDPEDVWTWGNPVSQESIESYSSILQSKFLDGHLVTTASWRKDTVNQASGDAPTLSTGLTSPDPVPLTQFLDEVSQSTTSYGAVVHAPDRWMPEGVGLSLHYVDSSNFAAGAPSTTVFNDLAEFQSGQTEEYGFAFSALNDKLYLRYNKFETVQANDKLVGKMPAVGNDLKNVMENNTPEALAAAGWDLNDPNLFHPGFLETYRLRPADPGVPNDQTTWLVDNISGTNTNYFQDTQSTGSEIEVSYTPTENWRFAFNASSSEVAVSNVMPLAAPELTRIANDIFLDPKMGDLFITPDPEMNDDGTYNNQSLLRSRADNVLNDIALSKSNEGGTLQEIRKWRWNLVTNYSFSDESPLSGFGVGAGVRWQDDVVLGTPLKEELGETVPDHDNAFYGPTETDIDLWLSYSTKIFGDQDLRLQARVRNITSDGDLIPLKINPDGQVALWRFAPPKVFELSARLRF